MEPTSVEALATGAHDAARSDTAETWLHDHLGRPRWEADAAYAVARRQDQEPAWGRAADLLEVLIAGGRKDAYGPPRFWHRMELTLLPMLALVGVQVVVAVDQGVWYRVPMSLLYLGVPLSHMLAARRQDAVIPQVPERTGTLPARASRLVSGVVAEVKRTDDDAQIVATLVTSAAGGSATSDVDRRLAALALAQAQRQIAASLVRGRARCLRLLDQARRQMVDSVSG